MLGSFGQHEAEATGRSAWGAENEGEGARVGGPPSTPSLDTRFRDTPRISWEMHVATFYNILKVSVLLLRNSNTSPIIAYGTQVE